MSGLRREEVACWFAVHGHGDPVLGEACCSSFFTFPAQDREPESFMEHLIPRRCHFPSPTLSGATGPGWQVTFHGLFWSCHSDDCGSLSGGCHGNIRKRVVARYGS